MRTTLTVDDTVDQALRELAAQQHSPYRDVVNQALRAGLGLLKQKSKQAGNFRIHPHRGGFRPGIDPNKLNQLLDDLDVESFSAKADR